MGHRPLLMMVVGVAGETAELGCRGAGRAALDNIEQGSRPQTTWLVVANECDVLLTKEHAVGGGDEYCQVRCV